MIATPPPIRKHIFGFQANYILSYFRTKLVILLPAVRVVESPQNCRRGPQENLQK